MIGKLKSVPSLPGKFIKNFGETISDFYFTCYFEGHEFLLDLLNEDTNIAWWLPFSYLGLLNTILILGLNYLMLYLVLFRSKSMIPEKFFKISTATENLSFFQNIRSGYFILQAFSWLFSKCAQIFKFCFCRFSIFGAGLCKIGSLFSFFHKIMHILASLLIFGDSNWVFYAAYLAIFISLINSIFFLFGRKKYHLYRAQTSQNDRNDSSNTNQFSIPKRIEENISARVVDLEDEEQNALKNANFLKLFENFIENKVFNNWENYFHKNFVLKYRRQTIFHFLMRNLIGNMFGVLILNFFRIISWICFKISFIIYSIFGFLELPLSLLLDLLYKVLILVKNIIFSPLELVLSFFIKFFKLTKIIPERSLNKIMRFFKSTKLNPTKRVNFQNSDNKNNICIEISIWNYSKFSKNLFIFFSPLHSLSIFLIAWFFLDINGIISSNLTNILFSRTNFVKILSISPNLRIIFEKKENLQLLIIGVMKSLETPFKIFSFFCYFGLSLLIYFILQQFERKQNDNSLLLTEAFQEQTNFGSKLLTQVLDQNEIIKNLEESTKNYQEKLKSTFSHLQRLESSNRSTTNDSNYDDISLLSSNYRSSLSMNNNNYNNNKPSEFSLQNQQQNMETQQQNNYVQFTQPNYQVYQPFQPAIFHMGVPTMFPTFLSPVQQQQIYNPQNQAMNMSAYPQESYNKNVNLNPKVASAPPMPMEKRKFPPQEEREKKQVSSSSSNRYNNNVPNVPPPKITQAPSANVFQKTKKPK